VDYINVNIDGFRENGAGIFDLSVGSQLVESLTTDFGARISYTVSTPIGVLVPLLRLEWEHQYMGSSRLITGSLVADPLGTKFSVATSNPTRDYLNLGASISAQFKHGVSSFISFDTQLGRSNISTYSLNGGLRVDF
jgi:outer membrane autotransporter protein